MSEMENEVAALRTKGAELEAQLAARDAEIAQLKGEGNASAGSARPMSEEARATVRARIAKGKDNLETQLYVGDASNAPTLGGTVSHAGGAGRSTLYFGVSDQSPGKVAGSWAWD